MQRAEFEQRPESRHCQIVHNLAFSAACLSAPTFGVRKLSFEKYRLTDGSEPNPEVVFRNYSQVLQCERQNS